MQHCMPERSLSAVTILCYNDSGDRGGARSRTNVNLEIVEMLELKLPTWSERSPSNPSNSTLRMCLIGCCSARGDGGGKCER